MSKFKCCWVDPDDETQDQDDHAPDCDDRIYVNCDDNCKALMNPVSPIEMAHSYLHWRYHAYLHGCSHGR